MCYCNCDEDSPQFWKEAFPAAIKRHICCECGSIIDPGEKYNKISGMWDEFATFKTCMSCFEIRKEASSQTGCCPAFGYLYDTFGSEFEYAACINKGDL